MRSEAKVTSKGQITIPIKIRRALGVKPGDKVVFEQKGDRISVRTTDRKSVFEKYRGILDIGIPQGRQAVIDYVRELRDDEE